MTQGTNDDAILAIVDQHRHSTGQVNSTSLAKALRKPRTTVQAALNRLAIEGRLAGPAALPGFAIKEITEQTDGDGDVQKKWVKQARLGDKFEMPAGIDLVGVSALVDPEDNTKLKWLIGRKAREGFLSIEDVKEALSDLQGHSSPIALASGCDPSRFSFYPTADIHLGLLAWGKDTGRSWDLAIAEREMIAAHAELVDLTPPTSLAILLDLGDQFHMNDQSNATPMNKNRLDVDGRFPKVAKVAVRMRRKMIEMALRRHERVIYRGVRGNHDPEAQMWLSVGLSMLFENQSDRVIVDDDPSDFFFHEFGKTAILANHGDKIKPDKLPGIMAADYPEAWGRTEYRYCFSGHIHRERSGEDMNVRWETLRTINPGDNFSYSGGWRAGHELTSITYSGETGQRHRQYVPV
jgi:hypothetical protein